MTLKHSLWPISCLLMILLPLTSNTTKPETPLKMMSNSDPGSSSTRSASISSELHNQPAQLSRYESQKRRDWNTFGQYLRNQRPPVALPQCNYGHVLEFLRYLDQFGKTKVHAQGCIFFGNPESAGPCTCPLRQAWGSLDALIGRLRAAYEENGGSGESNPFANGAIRVYLREVRDAQAKARGIPYKKKKKRKISSSKGTSDEQEIMSGTNFNRQIQSSGI